MRTLDNMPKPTVEVRFWSKIAKGGPRSPQVSPELILP